MKKFILCFFIFFIATNFVLAQNKNKLEEKLRIVYEQIFNLERQLPISKNPEIIKNKIRILKEKAKELNLKIQKINHYYEETFFNKQNNIPETKTNNDKIKRKEEIEILEKMLKEKYAEIEKIQAQLEKSTEKDRNYFKLYKQKLLEEIDILKEKLELLHYKYPKKNLLFTKEKDLTQFGTDDNLSESPKYPKEDDKQQEFKNSEESNLPKITNEEMEILKEVNPEYFNKLKEMERLTDEASKLAKIIEFSYGEERKKRIKELSMMLYKLFDLRTFFYNQELIEREQELRKMKENLELRKKHKEIIINRRLKEITGELEGLEW